MNGLLGACILGLFLPCQCVHAQGLQSSVIEYFSNGMKYQTLTRSGVTVIFTHLTERIHEYSIIQAAVSNGSTAPYIIRPEDFTFLRADGSVVKAVPARTVIDMLMQKGTSSDVVKLVTTYEASVYGNAHFKSTNGYEQRRQSALAMSGTKLKAATTASAIALVQTRLNAGDTTDGAVFFASEGKPLIGGRLVVRTSTDLFEFNPE
jgi:hypothetical protein